MKFAEHLTAHITPEWRKQYITYEEMKAKIYLVVEEAPSAESVEPEVLRRHFANFDETFFHYCENELKKINTFYSEKLAEATRKFATLQNELQVSLANRSSSKVKSHGKTYVPARKLQELKLAFSEFYLSLILLQNYQNLNFTGFRKILKKHDKLLNVDLGAKWRVENVETSHIYTNKDIDRLIKETEDLVTAQLEGGDRQKAMKRLRVPPLGEQQSPWTTFKVGLFSGSFIVLLLAVVLSGIFHEGSGKQLQVAFQLYRGPFLIIQFLFLMGVNVYGWRSSGVNHVLIFELDPRNHLSEQHLIELSAILGVIWTLSLLSFLYSDSLSIPPYVNPLALAIIMVIFLVNPLKIFRHEARFWVLRVMGRIVSAPIFHVGFADFWLADQLNSLVNALLDFQFLICYYATGDLFLQTSDVSQCSTNSFIVRPIVNCLPAWFRFAQCLRRYSDSKEAFPHLVNAGKYSTTFLVVAFSTLRAMHESEYDNQYENPYLYLWVLSALVSSCYSYAWDIFMDWGLLDSSAGENKFYGKRLFILPQRFVWNFFRLENEHLNNCGKFRAVRDISVAPIDSSDQTHMIRMMDEENGVVNRRKRKGGKKMKDERPLLPPDYTMDMDVTV